MSNDAVRMRSIVVRAVCSQTRSEAPDLHGFRPEVESLPSNLDVAAITGKSKDEVKHVRTWGDLFRVFNCAHEGD